MRCVRNPPQQNGTGNLTQLPGSMHACALASRPGVCDAIAVHCKLVGSQLHPTVFNLISTPQLQVLEAKTVTDLTNLQSAVLTITTSA